TYNCVKGMKLAFFTNYIGKQYIDNTSSNQRMLDPYLINNLLISYVFKTNVIKEIELTLKVNNLLDEEYESNAWVYRYYLGNQFYEMDGYFPQAGINFLAGIKLKF
ncbi:MAG: TonB-dependent receptor, partial [Bacteroidales bacterium]|nr:TonB-dependent receptor [Bacteroidales bacterium]